MSKKHKKDGRSSENTTVGLSHAMEYKLIKHDLVKVVILNAVYLAGVLVLYYANLRSGFLERWFEKVLHL